MSRLQRLRRRYRGPVTPGLAAGIGVGLLLHAVGLAWLAASWRFPAPPPPPPAFLAVGRDTPANRETTELLDPSPLFLPTRHNHGAVLKAGGAPAAEDSPLPYRFEPLESRVAVAAVPPVKLSPEGVEGAAVADTWYAVGLRAPGKAPAGLPRCELFSESGVRLGALDLAGGRAGELLVPAEFFIEIDAYGMQPPVLLSGTGNAAADETLRAEVAAALAKRRPGVGRYRVVAAP